jgi:hypothetical protein
MHPTTTHRSDDAARNELRAAVALLDSAETAGDAALLSQALAEVSRCHRNVGALAEADWYAKRGLAVARTIGAVDASVDALCHLAELALERAERLEDQDEARGANRLREAVRDHGYEAAQLARHTADPQWEVTVLLRVADLFDRLGDHDDAIVLQTRAMSLMTGHEVARPGHAASR